MWNDRYSDGWGGALHEGEGGGSGAGDGGAAGAGDKGAGAGEGDKRAGLWYAGIENEAVRDLMAAKAFDDPKKVGEAYYHLNRLHSGSDDYVVKPAADADPKQLAEFYNKVNGVPADAKGYDLKFGEDVKVDEGFLGTAKGWFHAHGLRPDQAQGLANDWNKFVTEAGGKAVQEKQAEADTQVAQLRQKYDAQGKGAFDQFVANGQKAVAGLELPKDMLDRLDASHGVASTLELLAAIGSRIGGEAPFRGDDRGGGFDAVSTPEMARVELAKLQGEKGFQDSLLDIHDSMHAVNTARYRKLQEVAYGKRK
ncbi:MAG: hypothetical protein Q8P46_06955 [Hyphomicrobiales bacterium]|nr:hypothetical protein [Hyphomicrobiales bacterium]